jgi:hypothetical protein
MLIDYTLHFYVYWFTLYNYLEEGALLHNYCEANCEVHHQTELNQSINQLINPLIICYNQSVNQSFFGYLD